MEYKEWSERIEQLTAENELKVCALDMFLLKYGYIRIGTNRMYIKLVGIRFVVLTMNDPHQIAFEIARLEAGIKANKEAEILAGMEFNYGVSSIQLDNIPQYWYKGLVGLMGDMHFGKGGRHIQIMNDYEALSQAGADTSEPGVAITIPRDNRGVT